MWKMRGGEGFACLGVAVDGGADSGLLKARVALYPAELRLPRRTVPARRHGPCLPEDAKTICEGKLGAVGKKT